MLLSVPYPDTLPAAHRMTQAEFEKEARLLLAARLFEDRKICSSQAAKMAGTTRREFLQKTNTFGLTAAMPSADEIAEDAGA